MALSPNNVVIPAHAGIQYLLIAIALAFYDALEGSNKMFGILHIQFTLLFVGWDASVGWIERS